MAISRRVDGKSHVGSRILPALTISVVGAISVLYCAALNKHTLGDFPSSTDEWTYVYQARTFAKGRVVNPAHPQQQILTPIHTVNRHGRVYGKYPPGYPALLALGTITGVERLINPILAGFLAVLVWLVLRRLLTGVVAWGGLALLWSTPFYSLNGASYFSHTAATLWIFLAFVCVFVVAKSGPLVWIGYISLSLACLTRPFDALPLVILCGFHGAFIRKRKGDFAVFALALFAGGAAFAAYNWATTGDPRALGYDVCNQSDHSLYPGPSRWGGWWAASEYFGGTKALSATGRKLRELYRVFPSVLLLGCGALFVGRSAFRFRGVQAWAGSFVILLVFANSWVRPDGGYRYGPRYYHSALPFLSVWVSMILHRVTGQRQWLTFAVLLAASVFTAVATYPVFVTAEKECRIRSKLFHEVEAASLRFALVFVASRGNPAGGELLRNDPGLSANIIFARDLGSAQNREVSKSFPGRTPYVAHADGTITELEYTE